MNVQLTFRHMNPTFELEEQIFKEAKKLERACPQQLSWCHVIIERAHRHTHEGRPYRVCVSIQGLRGYQVASSESDGDMTHDNPLEAITNAFHAIRSQVLSKAHGKWNGIGRGHRPFGQEKQPWD